MAEVIYVAFARTLWPPPPPPRLAAPSSPHTRRAGNADDQGVAATSPAEAVSRVGEPPSSAVTARSAVQRRGRAAPDGGAQQGENGRRGRPNLDDLEEPLLLGGGDASTAGAASTPAGIAVCEEGARGGADDGDDRRDGAAPRSVVVRVRAVRLVGLAPRPAALAKGGGKGGASKGKGKGKAAPQDDTRSKRTFRISRSSQDPPAPVPLLLVSASSSSSPRLCQAPFTSAGVLSPA